MNKEKSPGKRRRNQDISSNSEFFGINHTDSALSTLPLRDLEVPEVTTVNTVRDYLGYDMAMPKDPKFADKVDMVPIPTKKNFSGTPDEIATFLSDLARLPEDAQNPYALSSIRIGETGNYFKVQLRMRYFQGMPARVVLFPQDTDQRTFGIFTTEKALH